MHPEKHNCYHPFIVLSYYLGILPNSIAQKIPKTTRHYWSNTQHQKLYGYEWFEQHSEMILALKTASTNKKLHEQNRLLLKCIAVSKFIGRHKQRLKIKAADVTTVVVNKIKSMASNSGISTCLKLTGMSKEMWHELVYSKKCNRSFLQLCVRKHPQQLLSKEASVIKNHLFDIRYFHWPLNAVYHLLRRSGTAAFALSTFYKYASALKGERKLPASRRTNHTKGIRAQTPFELLHIDITIFKTHDGVKSYIYIIQDNYSRKLLFAKAYLQQKAVLMKQAVVETIQTYCTASKVVLLTDDGIENRLLSSLLIDGIQLTHTIAQKDIHFSNSMIEAVNKQLKYRWLYRMQITDHAALQKHIDDAVHDYNNRPHHVLHGLSPGEAAAQTSISHIIPTIDIKAAKAARNAEHSKQNCCGYSF